MREESQQRSLQTIRDVASLAQVALFVGVAYVFFFAPVRAVSGEAGLKEYPAAAIGIGFWAFAALALTGGVQ